MSDVMGLGGGYGARAAGESLEDIVRQRVLREALMRQAAETVLEQRRFEETLAQRQAEQAQQESQFGRGLGQRQTEHGFEVQKHAEGAPQRAADVEATTVRTEGQRGQNEDAAIVRGILNLWRGGGTPSAADRVTVGINEQTPEQKQADELEQITTHGGESRQTVAAQANAAAAAAGRRRLGDLTPAQSAAVFKYQDDFARDSKPFIIMRDAYQRVVSSAQSPDAAGDLSLIFGYMKILDPNSVVRETEYANAQNAAGVPDRVRNAYNQVMDGVRLNPEQRKQFLSRAQALFKGAQRNQKQVMDQYAKRAQMFDIDPSYVVEDLDTGAGEQAPQVLPEGVTVTRTK